MDREYLSNVVIRLRPFVREQTLHRIRLERVLGTLQMPGDIIRPEIEHLLAEAGITIEEDPVVEPVVASPTPAAAIAAARCQITADRSLADPTEVSLSAQQEVGLALLIRGSSNRPLEQGDFAQLTGEARQAAECLYLHTLDRVRSLAQKYPPTGMTSEDIFQHGAVGLIRAVEMFDPSRGHRFWTYATQWVRRSITRGIAEEARLIRLPGPMIERLRMVGEQRALLPHDGQTPSPAVLARACELDEESVLECLRLDPPDLPSLDMKIGDGEATLADVLDIEDPPQDSEPASYLPRLRERLRLVLDSLSEREAGVISMRFGLVDDEPKTLEEIGKIYGVGRERIRTIEGEVLQKLRHPSRSRLLEPFYDPTA